MRFIAAIFLAMASSAAVALNDAEFEADRKIWTEIEKISETTYKNYCHKLIREQSDRQIGLNRFRISPSEACECAASEAKSGMAASPNYRTYARVMVNSVYASAGEPPRFPHGNEEDAVIVEASRVFDQSWANCFMRLKKN